MHRVLKIEENIAYKKHAAKIELQNCYHGFENFWDFDPQNLKIHFCFNRRPCKSFFEAFKSWKNSDITASHQPAYQISS